jgi:undecaprenyl-diphosphatase
MGLVLAGLEDSLRTPQVIVVTLAVVGLLMLVADRLGRRARRAEDLGYGEAFVLGVAQGLALIPGVSRSGATITTGLAFGLDRESAAKFSFLIGIPAMLAAAAHEGRHLLGHPMDAVTKEVFLIGIVASGVVGYATVKFFLRYLINHSLAAFAWYRIALAAVTLAWLIA